MPVSVKIINRSPYPLPAYETVAAAGLDIRAHIAEPVDIASLARELIPTGLFIELPVGYEGQVRPRSGLALRQGVTLLNSPGTIDADYRGELKVLLVNLSQETVRIEPGTRIAQLVVTRHEQVEWEPVEELTHTSRGAGGFGHTGL